MYSWVTFNHLKEWTKGTLCNVEPSSKIVSISSDTRTLKPQEVFIALRGDHFDGHDYLQQAQKIGASLHIIDKPTDLKIPSLLVKDTLRALVDIARALRAEFKGPVFAVTGSAGKSSTRDMIATLLGPNTLKAPASFNNLLGVSKTLCLLEECHKQVVLEVGMNHLHEIEEIANLFEPNLGLITNIGDAHIGNLGSQENIFKAKKELFDFLGKSNKTLGLAVNLDDPLVTRAWKESAVGKKAMTFSTKGNSADVKMSDIFLHPDTCHLMFSLQVGQHKVAGECSLFGLHHAENLAAAVAAVSLTGVSVEEIQSRLCHILPAPHRGVTLQFGEDCTLIDESYNSNPSALRSSLKSLDELAAHRRRVLVIGEMREMGTFTEKVHREAGSLLSQFCNLKSAVIVGVGTDAKYIVEEAEKGIFKGKTHWCAKESEVDSILNGVLEPQDILFVKGSHGVRLDLLVDRIALASKGI